LEAIPARPIFVPWFKIYPPKNRISGNSLILQIAVRTLCPQTHGAQNGATASAPAGLHSFTGAYIKKLKIRTYPQKIF